MNQVCHYDLNVTRYGPSSAVLSAYMICKYNLAKDLLFFKYQVRFLEPFPLLYGHTILILKPVSPVQDLRYFEASLPFWVYNADPVVWVELALLAAVLKNNPRN